MDLVEYFTMEQNLKQCFNLKIKKCSPKFVFFPDNIRQIVFPFPKNVLQNVIFWKRVNYFPEEMQINFPDQQEKVQINFPEQPEKVQILFSGTTGRSAN
jgi:hypothetical protein